MRLTRLSVSLNVCISLPPLGVARASSCSRERSVRGPPTVERSVRGGGFPPHLLRGSYRLATRAAPSPLAKASGPRENSPCAALEARQPGVLLPCAPELCEATAPDGTKG